MAEPQLLSEEQIAGIEAQTAPFQSSYANKIRALCATVRALRTALEQIQHRCMCCITMKECSQAVIDIDGITRKALGNQIHGYKVGNK